MAELDLVEIYRAKNIPQAMLLQLALEESGIRSTLDNEVLDGAPGDLALGWPTAPRIMVDRPDEAKARGIAVNFDQAEVNGAEGSDLEDDAATCLDCGQPMPAGAEMCPACGWSYGVQDADAVIVADESDAKA
jgi:Putative prokaryotic signal transducing protein